MQLHGIRSSADLSTAFRRAERFVRQAGAAALAFSSVRAPQENEMARLVLMGLAARAKYDHLYVERRDLDAQLEISFKAFENYRLCAELLTGYPPTLHESEQLVERDAVINFVYKWCMDAAGERPKNFQQMYKSRGATLSAANIEGLMRPYAQRLPLLSLSSHPATYYVIEKLLVQPPLPFGIQVPF